MRIMRMLEILEDLVCSYTSPGDVWIPSSSKRNKTGAAGLSKGWNKGGRFLFCFEARGVFSGVVRVVGC